jgi:uncharacterized membrane protein YfcA
MIFLFAIAFLAGFIDAVVGGGGLIQLPAMMIALPHLPLQLILGTNKVAAVCGTLCAVWRYQKSLQLDLRPYIPAIAAAFIGSFVGAVATSYISPQFMKPLVLWLLIAVWIFFLIKPNFGSAQARVVAPQRIIIFASLLGLLVGFYDGFFGPGTGTWFIVGGISLLGLNFLQASALAKILNVATNVAAIVSFARIGAIDWKIAILLGIANVAGSLLGARLAIRKGSKFVRVFFLIIVGCMIIKLAFGS